MKPAPIPDNERDRLTDLYTHNILDSLPERDFDHLTKIASEICQTPISMISIVDSNRQWFKSKVGLDTSETPREVSFCAHAIVDPYDIFVVPNSREDERFADNPLVTGEPYVTFYAGIPLVSEAGHPLGTLCVIDNKPKQLTDTQKETLRALAEQVVKLLELRKKNAILKEMTRELAATNAELEKFAFVVAHDMTAPCNNIANLADMLDHTYADKIDADGKEMLGHIKDVSHSLKGLIHDVLDYSRTIYSTQQSKSSIKCEELIKDLKQLLELPKNFTLEYECHVAAIVTSKTALLQILLNLVQNAVKYNDKDSGNITIRIWEDTVAYWFTVEDNGKGIAPDYYEKIFELFETLSMKDRFAQDGYGIGLFTVKKLVERLGGNIKVASNYGEGTVFNFSLSKELYDLVNQP